MTTQPQLIPKPPRRMLQPRKDEIRRRLEVSQAQAAFDATPRWWRLWHRVWARVVEVDSEIASAVADAPRELGGD
jgi:hypothetical protein